MTRKKFIYSDFTLNGAGTQNNASGNYSSTPGSYRLSAGDGIIGDIHGIHVSISDSKEFELDKFGAETELVNGIKMYQKNSQGDVMEDFFNGSIMSNRDLLTLADEIEYGADFKGKEEQLVAKFRFLVDGQPLVVDFRQGEYLEFYLNDDFSDLDELRFIAYGLYREKTYE